jgi:anti-sigma factor RsiW
MATAHAKRVAGRRRKAEMTCSESEILVHGLLDDELDAGHARTLEAHLRHCSRCASQLQRYKQLQQALSSVPLHLTAPVSLRQRIEAALPSPPKRSPSRLRSTIRGFVMGSAMSAAIAATLVVAVLRPDPDQHLFGDLVTAHVRSLQGEHLTDVRASDQHAVKPWFNGKVAVAPPVVDLALEGFPLVGGRLDYVDGKAVASIVYQRRAHVINVFVTQAPAAGSRDAELMTMQGFNIRCWTSLGLEFFAVSDVAADELHEFAGKFQAALGGA